MSESIDLFNVDILSGEQWQHPLIFVKVIEIMIRSIENLVKFSIR